MTTVGLGVSSISYLLNDTFTTDLAAGAVNATAAEPGPGTRTVTDTDVDALLLTGGVARFQNPNSINGNPGLWYDSQTRAAGLLVKAVATFAAFSGFSYPVGFDADASALGDHQFRVTSAGTLQTYEGGVGPSIATLATGTHTLIVVLRATGAFYFVKPSGSSNYVLAWRSNAGALGSMRPSSSSNSQTTFDVESIVALNSGWLPIPLVSDGFSGSTSDGLGHAEGVAGGLGSGGNGASWAGATATLSGGTMRHVVGVGSELLTDGGYENWNSATDLTDWTESLTGTSTVNREASVVQSGTYAVRMDIDASNNGSRAQQAIAASIGNWVIVDWWGRSSATGKTLRFSTSGTFAGPIRNPGTTWTQYTEIYRVTVAGELTIFFGWRSSASSASLYADNVSAKVLALSSLFRTTDLAKADVFASVAVTLTAGTQAGLVINLDSTSSPANFVIVYHNGTQVFADKCVAGTYTNLIASTVTYSAGARLEVRKDGTAYRVYYNNAFVSTQQTISDAGIISNTLHGTFSTYDQNTFDDLVIYATGTGGEYAALDTY